MSTRAWCTVDMLLLMMARLADAKLPENPIDGLDVWDVVSGTAWARANPH